MSNKIEHVNLHVSDIDRVLGFLKCAFPEFYVRYDSESSEEERWVHFGNADNYFALYQASDVSSPKRRLYSSSPGINHIGLVVEDVVAIRQRLSGAGYLESTIDNFHPARSRIYFHDPDGNDWEFIQYFTDVEEERNDYSSRG